MIRYLLAALLAGAVLGLASNAHAWSFSADAPTQFTFAEKDLNTQKSATADKHTSTDLSGYVLTLTDKYLGVGYEQYKVSGNATANANPGTIHFKYALSFQIYDVVLDLPMKYLHTTLGYGLGQVHPQLTGPSGSGVPHAEAADVSQWFLRLGIPLGQTLDLHVGYNVLHAEKSKLISSGGAGGPPDSLQVSGQTLTAGIRLAW